ncbi:MAG: Uma2 family endonuclease [Planctomycetota bacterium]|nr:Uma2 family endonuclease [Planctomycetota bacterium]
MATVIPTEPTGLMLYDVDWSAYETILAGLNDRAIRLTYDNGELEIMSPSDEHERIKTLVGRMIETMTEQLEIPIRSAGSTTLKSQLKKKGLEPDECYYVLNEPLMRGRDKIDLQQDPPPDLAVEVDITSSSLDRMSIYAALGIPEVWRYDGAAIRVQRLQEDGHYREVEQSLNFPGLLMSGFNDYLGQRNESDETTWIRSFRAWVAHRQRS